jgi:hypothetical protein
MATMLLRVCPDFLGAVCGGLIVHSGHGSFSNDKNLNSLVGHLTHSSILVPYHGWLDHFSSFPHPPLSCFCFLNLALKLLQLEVSHTIQVLY